MTYSLSYADEKEIIEALIDRFLNWEIATEQFRSGLIRRGYNATDADAEIEHARARRTPYIPGMTT